ncbi:MAG TPA: hypothetical protein VKU41_15415, partial [Polyangiaceae bacterium]|nr:hypothetical protein [Polyangiaceae bacterium]
LLFVVLPAAIGVAVVAVPVLKAYRMRRAGGAEEPIAEVRRRRAAPSPPADPVARVATARSRLREAQGVLMSAQALLDDAARRSPWDIAGLSIDRGRAKQSSFAAAVRHMRSAADLSRDAFDLLKIEGPGPVPDLDGSALLFEMDSSWFADGVLPSAAMHGRIREARDLAARMLQSVDAALTRLGSSAVGR